ncbi:GCG_CRPN prefix-to-repeats domain-containing protein [Bradyrhizobium genosp. P]|uniref:GCG_CRPN prefix-to-repeats domain-containing protein n=1 Tax=Bradyrhizobium genosp. P TaxID=83641 RepID=UPI003CEA4CD7
MKYLFAAAVLITTAFAGISAAGAAGGCGPGFHRGPYAGCVRNRGEVVVVPGAVVVERPVVVGPVVRACPVGFVWRYGRCRTI